MATKRYRVTISQEETGNHCCVRRAHDPVEAMLNVLRYCGMNNLHEQAFQVRVEPMGRPRE